MKRYIFVILFFVITLFYSNECYANGCSIEHVYIVIEIPGVIEATEEELKNGVTFDDEIKVYYKDGSDLINYELGKSFTVTYENNTSEGTGYITLKGIITREEHDKNPPKYNFNTHLYGSVTKTFKIKLKKEFEKVDLNSDKVKIIIPERTIISGGKGTEATVVVMVNAEVDFGSLTVNWVTLSRGKDYTLEYKNHYGLGNATVKIKALESSKFIKGEITKQYVIVQKNYDDVIENPDFYTEINFGDNGTAVKKFAVILSVIQVIGVVVSVITIMIIGMKFMFGSIEQKAEYKQTLVPWLVGAILLCASTTIPKIIYEMVSKW